jgi:hypothetical protein
MAFKGFQIFIVTLDIALRQKSMRHLFFIGIFYLCLGILAIIGLMRTNLRTRANLLSPWILLNISDISILIICIYIQKDIVGLVSWLCLLGINIIYGIIKPLQLLMQQWIKNIPKVSIFEMNFYSNVRGGGKLRSNFPTEREWVYNFANASMMTENGTFSPKKVHPFGNFFFSVINKKNYFTTLIRLPMAGLKIEFSNNFFDRVS